LEKMKFLEDAVLRQILWLLELLQEDDLSFPIFCHADEELSQLYKFALDNKFYLPTDLRLEITSRNL